ncbi:MAG: ribonuclease Z [Candidatus Bathyarchaeota archaeon]
MQVIFLGTGGGLPSVGRGLPCTALRYEGQIILFDCGEGTQRQMMRMKVGFSKKMKIFITHIHGDHLLGVPGILQTMSLLDRREKLEIYGPKGVSDFILMIKKHLRFGLRFPVEVFDVGAGIVCKENSFRVIAKWVEHSVPTLAYAFVENKKPGKFHPDKALKLGIPKGPLWHRLQHGKSVKLAGDKIIEPREVADPSRPGVKIVYSGDTRPCDGVARLARSVDLLIHDCTFDNDLADRAESDLHSTPKQAATVAKNAEVKKLVLTHISARYKDSSILLRQAKKVFKRVYVAEDFMKIEL